MSGAKEAAQDRYGMEQQSKAKAPIVRMTNPPQPYCYVLYDISQML